MTTRRRFLSAFALGVSTVFLPGTARGHGFRRSKCRMPCDSCRPPLRTGMCDYGCPAMFYGQAGNVLYYVCQCCEQDPSSYMTVWTTQPYSTVQGCQGISGDTTKCIKISSYGIMAPYSGNGPNFSPEWLDADGTAGGLSAPFDPATDYDFNVNPQSGVGLTLLLGGVKVLGKYPVYWKPSATSRRDLMLWEVEVRHPFGGSVIIRVGQECKQTNSTEQINPPAAVNGNHSTIHRPNTPNQEHYHVLLVRS
jgi:hypothetical protein